MSASIRKSWSGENLGKGFVQGLGIAGALGVANIVGKITDVFGDAIAAAREDQASIERLGASLRANISDWDGNTKAIEATIKARQGLGFSDDEQRDSLAKIVVATKDVNQALKVQRAAMDLARLKRISLAEAGDALVKVEAGQFRALKALGIQLPKNATATEALAAVEKAAAGQAEAFAKTDEGKLLVASVKVSEAMERLGYVLSGPVADGASAAADALDALFGLMDAHTSQTEAIGDAIKDQITNGTLEGLRQSKAALEKGISDINFWQMLFGHGQGDAEIAALKGQLADVDAAIASFARDSDVQARRAAEGIGQAARTAGGSWDDTAADMEKNRGRMADALAVVRKSFTKTADLADTALSRMRASWKKTVDYLTDSANQLISDAFDPIIAHDKLLADNSEVNAQRKILATKATTAAQKTAAREAQAALDDTMRDTASQLVILAAAGQTNSAAFKTGLANLKTYASTLKGSTKTAVDAAIAEIERISHINPTVTVHVKVPKITTVYSPTSGPHIVGRGYEVYDRGGMVPGPVGSPRPAIVHGGELILNPAQQRRLPDLARAGALPSSMSGATMSRSTSVTIGDINVSVSAAGTTGHRQAQLIADTIADALREQTARIAS